MINKDIDNDYAREHACATTYKEGGAGPSEGGGCIEEGWLQEDVQLIASHLFHHAAAGMDAPTHTTWSPASRHKAYKYSVV